jgi:hypothetical protein
MAAPIMGIRERFPRLKAAHTVSPSASSHAPLPDASARTSASSRGHRFLGSVRVSRPGDASLLAAKSRFEHILGFEHCT